MTWMDGTDVDLMEEGGGEGWMIVMNGGRLSLGFFLFDY